MEHEESSEPVLGGEKFNSIANNGDALHVREESMAETEMPVSREDDITHWKLFQTAALFAGCSSISFYLCLIGPSLLDLQITANTTTKSMTMIFIGRSLGGMIGAALFAFVFAKMNRSLVLAAAFFTMAFVMTSLPWLGDVIAVTAVYGIGGVGYSVADAGTFTQVMRIWGSKNGPWLQAMYACFFIGCLISPLLAKPFLVANEKETVRECYGTMESTALHSIINSSRYPVYNVHDNGDRSLAPSQDNLTDMLLSNTRTDFLNSTTQSWQIVKNANSSLNESPKSVETEIWKAYVIAGIILCCATLSHIAIFVAARHRKALHMYSAPPGTGRPDGGAGGRVLVWLLIVQMAAFFFLFCCMQRGVSSYLFAYAVHCHAWQKGPAAFLKMAYQAGSLGGRLMSIIILHHVTPQTLLMTCCIGSVAALSGLTLAGGYVPVLWISTLVAGICVAPTYACGLSWGSQHFTVGGKVGAIFTLSGATSDILGSLVINLLYDQFGLATYSYFSLILTISMTAIALSMFITIRFINSKIPNRLKTITSIPESATVETDLGKESDFH